ncbi:MAG TPA: DUF4337 domain-containing protein [Polyangia bacterium]
MEETEIGEVGVDKQAEVAHEKAQEEKHRAPWLRWLALSSACFAVIAAIASLKSGHAANEALLKQSQATDQWAYFQAKGNKAATRLAEADILTELHADANRVAAIRADVGKYVHEQDEIKAEAQHLEKESKEDLTRHEWFASTVTMLQVAIGLSAIGALVESRKVWLASLVAGGLSAAVFFARWFMG